jgi:hypothetical protein
MVLLPLAILLIIEPFLWTFICVMFTFFLHLEGMMAMDDSEQNEIVESTLSQNTYVMVWVIASLASLAIYVRYF